MNKYNPSSRHYIHNSANIVHLIVHTLLGPGRRRVFPTPCFPASFLIGNPMTLTAQILPQSNVNRSSWIITLTSNIDLV